MSINVNQPITVVTSIIHVVKHVLHLNQEIKGSNDRSNSLITIRTQLVDAKRSLGDNDVHYALDDLEAALVFALDDTVKVYGKETDLQASLNQEAAKNIHMMIANLVDSLKA